jgi:hypothetical protein
MRKFLLLVLVAAVASCSLKSEKARVALPGTNLVLVLEEDEKRMTRYHLVIGDTESAEGFLGPPNAPLDGKVEVKDNRGTIRLSWGPEGLGQFVVIDTLNCRIVEHSNASDPPPGITGCARHSPAA